MSATSTVLILRPNQKAVVVVESPTPRPSYLFPGRTINQFYNWAGSVAETTANKVAHRAGLGPLAATQRIHSYFEHGGPQEKEQRVRQPNKGSVSILRENCTKLFGYTSPTESVETQMNALDGIVDCTTRYPGLRHVFLENTPAHILRPVTLDALCAVWKPEDHRCTNERDKKQLDFFVNLAAACLLDSTMAVFVEAKHAEDPKASVVPDSGSSYSGWTVVEFLLLALEELTSLPSAHTSTVHSSSAVLACVCVRYLGGVLELPSFWRQSGRLFDTVLRKVNNGIIQRLRDVDIQQTDLGAVPADVWLADFDGLNILCTAFLRGIHALIARRGVQSSQETNDCGWYSGTLDVVSLLRYPKAEAMLPNAHSLATSDAFMQWFSTSYRVQAFSTLISIPDDNTSTSNASNTEPLALPTSQAPQPRDINLEPPSTPPSATKTNQGSIRKKLQVPASRLPPFSFGRKKAVTVHSPEPSASPIRQAPPSRVSSPSSSESSVQPIFKLDTSEPEKWFSETFSRDHPRSSIQLAFVHSIKIIIGALAGFFVDRPQLQQKLRVGGPGAGLRQVHTLFTYFDEQQVWDTELLDAFRQMAWKHGGVQAFFTKEMATRLQHTESESSLSLSADVSSATSAEWFTATFLPTATPSDVRLAVTKRVIDILRDPELARPLENHPTLHAEIRAAHQAEKKVEILFAFLDDHSSETDLIECFQSAIWKFGGNGVTSLFNDEMANKVQYRLALQNTSRALAVGAPSPWALPEAINLDWFPATFVSTTTRSRILSALTRNITDILQDQELAGVLSDYAEIPATASTWDQVEKVFQLLDDQPGNTRLIEAFQRAAWRRGGVKYLFNNEVKALLSSL
ncbi:hypothetical protein MIND_00656100 [Mycena indigotica]|uniref:Uncharacterized protein n=1 Tax=Mycena indigotica TaxID=2126181 RepID=A0A8H6W0X7_9AGAR|nr:uncharacterized protein MIND_00656100 [Mycena indigotica]KAF7300932.1 hypothetical protein MIND_00656100 [Mycena indigotica]